MRTAQVAQQAGVNTQTLRYYERRGLLPDPGRTGAGYRIYGPDAVRIVRFVKRAQELGFTLTQIETLLDLADGGPDSCEATRHLATEKITELDGKIASLRAMRASLARLADTCTRPRGDRDCPLLHNLDPTYDNTLDNRVDGTDHDEDARS
ncbi:MAG: MerR family transcriptional regulator [Actinophytocola sp.]|uniref:MerR family transcriptional regulator n=1 Tax=Actinophytocola sp. TaxID=1872138 RepID=UPI0013205EAA|nr:MerR family DNA-binding protein [Actinophytocola sp.]MPZ85714.1 MerR family transcriptional regulator [Actinophytocola sp.]